MAKSYIDRCVEQVEEKLDTMIAMLRVGHTRTATAKSVGLKPTQLHDVLHKGKGIKGKCHDILVAVLLAEGSAQIVLEKKIIADAQDNVKTAQWLLARRFRLKERHEPEIHVLRRLDLNRLAQEEVKLKILEEKLRLLTEKKGDEMTADDWRAIMTDAKQASDRIKSLH